MIVRSQRVVLPDGIRPAAIHIRDGRIVAIDTAPASAPSALRRGRPGAPAAPAAPAAPGAPVAPVAPGAPAAPVTPLPPVPPGERILDVGELIVLPGLVDTHVHVNEPGRTDWEGFATATRAAAAGGVTTIVDMPLNSVPATTNVAGLEAKRQAAMGKCHVDVAFWGGAVPGNVADLEPLRIAGVRGFKCFMSPSGVDEFSHVSETDLRNAMPVVARLGVPLLVHAEWPARLRTPRGDPRRYRTWLDSRPPEAEVAAIDLLVRLAREFGTHVHIVHLATGDAIPTIRAARAEGIAVSVETCPHYLFFAADDIADGDTRMKCAPPIRERAERTRLWDGLLAGDVDLVATDHSPAPPAMKHVNDGDFVAAWGGIASLQLGLAAVWTGGHVRGPSPLSRDEGLSPFMLARWLSAGPARLAGLYPAKGVLAPGSDADLVIWDPDAETVVDGAKLYHRHALTPYHGQRLRGRVRTTILRGAVVFDDGECRGPATGRLL
ncbi:MAG TPA: allantoinase AllB [Vicinamibacterales bacterium]|nr:allantoinase AllB [Vicinamibacterales bacterium]